MCEQQGRTRLATEVDHIIPISQGGDVLDEANLQPLCHDCHIEKHGGRPRVAIDPETGLPLSAAEQRLSALR
jgi:5-methylcytosine-specific restriction endonuclease McrA